MFSTAFCFSIFLFFCITFRNSGYPSCRHIRRRFPLNDMTLAGFASMFSLFVIFKKLIIFFFAGFVSLPLILAKLRRFHLRTYLCERFRFYCSEKARDAIRVISTR